MAIGKAQITAQTTFKTEGGKLLYVHELSGQKVTYCEVGNIERRECSLGRFASRIATIEPNQ